MPREGLGEASEHTTFIVRITRTDGQGFTALIERVRTGEKARVRTLEHLGRVLVEMLETPVLGDTGPETRAEHPSPGTAPGNPEEPQS
jgi:hypothetical protein